METIFHSMDVQCFLGMDVNHCRLVEQQSKAANLVHCHKHVAFFIGRTGRFPKALPKFGINTAMKGLAFRNDRSSHERLATLAIVGFELSAAWNRSL